MEGKISLLSEGRSSTVFRKSAAMAWRSTLFIVKRSSNRKSETPDINLKIGSILCLILYHSHC